MKSQSLRLQYSLVQGYGGLHIRVFEANREGFRQKPGDKHARCRIHSARTPVHGVRSKSCPVKSDASAAQSQLLRLGIWIRTQTCRRHQQSRCQRQQVLEEPIQPVLEGLVLTSQTPWQAWLLEPGAPSKQSDSVSSKHPLSPRQTCYLHVLYPLQFAPRRSKSYRTYMMH